MKRRSASRDAGFTLVEMLVTVMIVGIAFAIIVGGVGVSLVTADYHRKQATVQASLRNAAEALKGAAYVSCATTTAYSDVLVTARTSAVSTASASTSHTAPALSPGQSNRELLLFYALANGSSFTPPSNTTEVWDWASTGGVVANRVTAELAEQAWPSASSTGSRVATSAASGNSVSHAVLLESSSEIARHGFSKASSAGSTTLSISKPPQTSFGDAMVAEIAVRGGTNTSITPPAGWSLIATSDNGTSVKSSIYQRTASGATTSYTWTFTPSAEAAGGIVSYGGVNEFVASVDSVKYWNGTTYGTMCPTPDAGLQLISMTVSSAGRLQSQSVDLVKRRP